MKWSLQKYKTPFIDEFLVDIDDDQGNHGAFEEGNNFHLILR